MKRWQLLEAAGYRVGDADEFLGLTDEESRLVGLRLAVSRAVRRLREARELTQQQLASKIGSSASRINKLEMGSTDVSLDLLFRSFFAVGGEWRDLEFAGQSIGRLARKKNSGVAKTTRGRVR